MHYDSIVAVGTIGCKRSKLAFMHRYKKVLLHKKSFRKVKNKSKSNSHDEETTKIGMKKYADFSLSKDEEVKCDYRRKKP